MSASLLGRHPRRNRWPLLASSASLALLVDLDGTLIEFASSPDEATLDAEAVALLQRLVTLGVQVVIVSGRAKPSIETMRHRVPGAWWFAEHGSWRWDPELSASPPTAGELDELAAKLMSVVNAPGMLVERKSLSVCFHWRRVDPTRKSELISQIGNTCDEWLEEHIAYERLDGVEALEIRRCTVHKGSVVGWLRERIRGVRIIAIGDDTTDEDMFAELDDRDASVGVGPRELTVDARAADVRAARAFLHWLAETREGRDLPLPIEPVLEVPRSKRARLVVMSNRTPALARGRTREVGGLASVLEPALRDEPGVWLGWSGLEREHESRISIDVTEQPARALFDLPASVRRPFYAGFCNSVLWPLLHGFPQRVRHDHGDWDAYVDANGRYARHAMALARPDATIWVHDYHLLLVARALRTLGHQGRIGLFLHVPFPSRDVLETVPWSSELVDAMLDCDLLGFQTTQFATNFLAAMQPKRGRRSVEVGVFPATIDPQLFRAHTDVVAEIARLREDRGDRKLLLGIDRLDYSKGVPERLEAYERFLERCPEWRRRVALLQISVPSRAEIPDYAELRHRVEGLVGRINERFGETDWVPVRYLYRSYDHHVLAQLYRLADVALVTPLRDGMNLVAKEFVAAQEPATPGVLVLSQYAGAAETLASAMIVNPFDRDGLAADIDRALCMPAAERVERHRMLLATLEQEGSAKLWARNFLQRLASAPWQPDGRLRSIE